MGGRDGKPRDDVNIRWDKNGNCNVELGVGIGSLGTMLILGIGTRMETVMLNGGWEWGA